MHNNDFLNETKKKKLLILGGAGVHCKVVETARKMGVYTIVADYLDDSPAKRIADEKVTIDIMDVKSLVDFCRANKVDGVLNFCNDPAQIPCFKVCKELGIPYYGTKEQVDILTNKELFKDFCNKSGLDIIKTFSEDDVEHDKNTYPVIVKPVDSRGSRGVSICKDKKELIAGIEKAKNESRTKRITIEEYMGGKQDLTLAYLVINYEPYLIRIGDRYLGKKEDGLDRQCILSRAPSLLTKEYLTNVNQRVIEGIKKLGIKDGPVFLQGFYDNGTVRFYDPGIRFPGSEYEKLLVKAMNLNLMEGAIAFCLSGVFDVDVNKIKESYLIDGNKIIIMYIPAGPGKICKFDGLEAISEMKCVSNVKIMAKVGDTIKQTGNVQQRVAEIDLLFEKNDSYDYILSSIRDIQNLFKVYDENNHDMIVSKFDLNLL